MSTFEDYMKAQGYNPDLTMVCSNFGPDDMRDAYEAGMTAAVVAYAGRPDLPAQPQAAPGLADAMAQLADEMFAEGQMIAPAYGEPDGMPDMADQIRAEVLHECSGRIRAIAGDVAGQPRLRDGIKGLIEDLGQSAKATAPSKKSVIEQTVAERLTVLLDQP